MLYPIELWVRPEALKRTSANAVMQVVIWNDSTLRSSSHENLCLLRLHLCRIGSFFRQSGRQSAEIRVFGTSLWLKTPARNFHPRAGELRGLGFLGCGGRVKRVPLVEDIGVHIGRGPLVQDGVDSSGRGGDGIARS